MMITLDDRLHEAGDDLRHAATRVPAREVPHARRSRGRVGGWVVASIAVAALVALPIWLGAFDADPPLGGEAASDLEIILGTEPDAIAFLAYSVTVDEALNLVEEIRQWEGVDTVAYVSQEHALIEYLELFADQPWVMPPVVESDPWILPASIRLLLNDGADAEQISARLRLLPGVIGGAGAHLSDTEMAEIMGQPSLSPLFVPGSARRVASTEQDGFGLLTLLTFDEVDLVDREVIWHCVTAIGDARYRQTVHDKPLVLGAGATCSESPEVLDFALIAGSACGPRVESLLAFHGLDATVTTVGITLMDGTTTQLTPANGAILFAWEGSRGLAGMTLNDDASAEMVSRVQADWDKYELAEYVPCA